MRDTYPMMKMHWAFLVFGMVTAGAAAHAAVSGSALGAAIFTSLAYFCLYPNKPSEVTAREALAETQK